MTDKDRLIELINKSNCVTIGLHYNDIDHYTKNLADYLIKHGVIISAEFKPLKDSCIYYNEKKKRCMALKDTYCIKKKKCNFYKEQ